MIVGILIALLITILLYALVSFAVSKLPVPAEFVWLVWLVFVILVVLVWWNRVLGPLIGPLP